MDAPADNKALVEEYRARTHRAELAVANIVAGCPGDLKVMELASILGKTIVPHGSDFSATFGVGRLTEFLEGNDSFFLEGHCPKNVKVIKFTPKGRSLDITPTAWPPRLRRDPVPLQHFIPAHHPALKPGQVKPPADRQPLMLAASLLIVSSCRAYQKAFLIQDMSGQERGDRCLDLTLQDALTQTFILTCSLSVN